MTPSATALPRCRGGGGGGGDGEAAEEEEAWRVVAALL